MYPQAKNFVWESWIRTRNIAHLESQNYHYNAWQIDNPVDEESPVRKNEMNLWEKEESKEKSS